MSHPDPPPQDRALGDPAPERGAQRRPPARDEMSPPWMGAPGYTPHEEYPPHGPMPGAPPYPPQTGDPPVAPVGRTSWAKALGATMIWPAVTLLLLVVLLGAPGSPQAAGAVAGRLVVGALLTSVVVWLIARRRPWRFPMLVLLALPFFLVVYAVTNATPR